MRSTFSPYAIALLQIPKAIALSLLRRDRPLLKTIAFLLTTAVDLHLTRRDRLLLENIAFTKGMTKLNAFPLTQ